MPSRPLAFQMAQNRLTFPSTRSTSMAMMSASEKVTLPAGTPVAAHWSCSVKKENAPALNGLTRLSVRVSDDPEGPRMAVAESKTFPRNATLSPQTTVAGWAAVLVKTALARKTNPLLRESF